MQRAKEPVDIKVEDAQLAFPLASLYVVGGHLLKNSAFLSDSVEGVMSSVRGTLSSYDLYYYRLSELFRAIGALQIPDKSGQGQNGLFVCLSRSAVALSADLCSPCRSCCCSAVQEGVGCRRIQRE